MRLTLHLIPATELATVIAALRPMAMAVLQRWQARVGVTPDQVKAVEDVVMDGLCDGPQTQQHLIARARKRASKAMRVWLDHSLGPLRSAIVDGLILYGPPRGSLTTFVRVDKWLPAQPRIDAAERRRVSSTLFCRPSARRRPTIFRRGRASRRATADRDGRDRR
jgi:hypothetical protein